MNNKDQHSFSSVLSINPYDDTYISERSGFLNSTISVNFSKEQFCVSHLNTKGFITTQISISKNIPQEDVEDVLFSKIYDDLLLDQAIEYQIKFIEVFNEMETEDRNFNAFIVDPFLRQDIFEETIERVKYIDFIVPSPLLLKSLYTKEIIQNNGVHCFIYFDKDDTFITIYNYKEFLYTKSINYSLTQMHERFCELYGEQVPYNDFIQFLTKESLKDTVSAFKNPLLKLYKEIFANINDVLTYVKRVLEIPKIDNIYIGSGVDIQTKLHEISEMELGIQSNDFNFDYGYESADTHINQIHSLMQLYISSEEDERYDCNFTVYNRPPEFAKRLSGQIILLTAASLVLAFAYPVTNWSVSYAKSIQYDLLQTEYKEIHNNRITRESIINNKLAQKKKLVTLLQTEEKNYLETKNTLIKIHDVKVNYPMKANLLYKLTKDLNNNKVNLESLEYSEDESKVLVLNLASKKDKQITNLLEYFTNKYQDRFHFSLTKIYYDEKEKQYFSQLKVNL